MIDLKVEQNKAFNNVLRRDLPIDLPSMIEHLKSEVKEFDRAPKMREGIDINKLVNCEDDEEFLLLHKMWVKDTKEGEAGDTAINLMSICDLLGIDLELFIMVNQRANSLRTD